MQEFLNRVIHGNCAEIMAYMPSESVDLTVTSPPYDNLRNYNGYSFPFEDVANQLYRVTKDGGVVIWVVGDETKDFCESMTSFKQAMHFKEVGFKLLDTMIYFKENYAPAYPTLRRYANQFEYMFVLVKGKKPKTFNPKQVPKSYVYTGNPKFRQKDGSLVKKEINNTNTMKNASNVWSYANQGQDKISHQHPAIFPEKLAEDHILSWSNPGDTVLDCFCGSGTTLKMAYLNARNFVGIECSSEYVELSQKRIEQIR